MSANPRPGMIRFNGAAVAYLVTICRECDMVVSHNDEERRMQWALEHGRVGHKVEFAVDVRPDPTQPFAFVIRETYQHQQRRTPPPGWQAQSRPSNRDPLLAQKTDNQVMSMKPDEAPPKKLNARDRRRQRRKDKQRNDTE